MVKYGWYLKVKWLPLVQSLHSSQEGHQAETSVFLREATRDNYFYPPQKRG